MLFLFIDKKGRIKFLKQYFLSVYCDIFHALLVLRYIRGDSLKTLYIDVYFMINFTVDILAIFLALKLTHLRIKMKRIILCGIIGGAFAIIELFIPGKASNLLLAASFLLLITQISCGMASLSRRIKFLLAFYISTFLISGIVSFMYELMDRYVKNILLESNQSTNRKALVFSLIILLIIGALRLFVMIFSSSLNEKSVRIVIDIHDKCLEVEALIDTGNLVKDPMNMNPVVFIKMDYAKRIFPREVIELSHLDALPTEYRKRIRLIPVTRNGQTHVMTGVRVDEVAVINGGKKECIEATIVIDKEEGTFGGYFALAPYVAVCEND